MPLCFILCYAFAMPPLWLCFRNREIAEDGVRQIDRRTKDEVEQLLCKSHVNPYQVPFSIWQKWEVEGTETRTWKKNDQGHKIFHRTDAGGAREN